MTDPRDFDRRMDMERQAEMERTTGASTPGGWIAAAVFVIVILALVFAGGIGEHSVQVRKEVCEGLRFLGVVIDETKNQNGVDTISDSSSAMQVRIVPSQEDRQIARHCRAMMRKV